MKFLCIPISLFVVVSCATRPIAVTSTQFSASVSGDAQAVPTKIKVGYDRSELIHLPSGRMKHGIVGGFDGEFRNFSGVGLTEFLLTGAAANPDAPEADSEPGTPERPMRGWKAISSNTRTNLGLELIGSDSPGPSFNFGFKRVLTAIFPVASKDKNGTPDDAALPSTLADVSIHASGLRNDFTPNGVASHRRLNPGDRGSRTVQTIATGRAAYILSRKQKSKEQLDNVITGKQPQTKTP